MHSVLDSGPYILPPKSDSVQDNKRYCCQASNDPNCATRLQLITVVVAS